MEMIELIKLLNSNRDELSGKMEFVVGYTLLNLLMDGEDTLPNIGKVSLLDMAGKKHLVINLNEDWQCLLKEETPIDSIFELVKRNIS